MPKTVPAAAATLPAPVYTRQSIFVIPYRVEGVQGTATEAVEVQLFVSGDGGRNWQPHSRVAPNQRLAFRASGDGEYCFALRTRDRSGAYRPATVTAAELRVIVDTTPPRLELEGRIEDDGRALIIWRLADENPRPDTLALRFRRSDREPWQNISFTPPQLAAGGGPRRGEARFALPAGTTEAQIQAEVFDAAGNQTLAYAQLVAAGAAQGNALAKSAWKPVDDGPGPQPVQPQPSVGAEVRGETFGRAEWLGQETGHNRLGQETGHNARSQESGVVALADTEAPRFKLVRQRQFTLAFDPGGILAESIASVELWRTDDGGRRWTRSDSKIDIERKIPVSVDQDGEYGFQLVLRTHEPRDGRPAWPSEVRKCCVRVDTTRPIVKLTSALPGTAAERGSVIFTWQAGDTRLAERPIALQMAERPEGPWWTIVTGLENTGRHVWTPSGRLPAQLYLRIEARDAAGNTAIDTLAEPLSR